MKGFVFQLTTVVALTVAAGFEDSQSGEFPESMVEDPSWWQRHERVGHAGVEVKVLGMFSGRWGYIHDDLASVKNPTWGIGLEVPGLCGLDFASIPQYVELERVQKASAWVRIVY